MKLEAMSFFQIASQRMEWLGARQQVVSENIANANTPNFTAREVTPFAEMVGDTRQSGIVTTDPKHIGGGSVGSPKVIDDQEAWKTGLDGNSVVLEQQSIKANEISEGYQLAAQLYRKGHDLLTLSVTGLR